MMGDRYHNETLDLLFDGVPKRSKYANRIKFRLDIIYHREPTTEVITGARRWCPLTNTQCRKLNGIMKSKTEQTFQKRLQKYIHFLAYATHYGALFNKGQIEEFAKEVREI